ncbi:unnamed protein product [Effrenium voratum]|nr:unnamed protein product [Effrenium voratum]CAJ1439032.1 unnamed protein product [Effrenium voratum]
MPRNGSCAFTEQHNVLYCKAHNHTALRSFAYAPRGRVLKEPSGLKPGQLAMQIHGDDVFNVRILLDKEILAYQKNRNMLRVSSGHFQGGQCKIANKRQHAFCSFRYIKHYCGHS